MKAVRISEHVHTRVGNGIYHRSTVRELNSHMFTPSESPGTAISLTDSEVQLQYVAKVLCDRVDTQYFHLFAYRCIFVFNKLELPRLFNYQIHVNVLLSEGSDRFNNEEFTVYKGAGDIELRAGALSYKTKLQ